eukprot:6313866-Amphidinium_carterae.1
MVIGSTGIEPEVTVARPYYDRPEPQQSLPPSEFCSTLLCHNNGQPYLLPKVPRVYIRYPWSVKVAKGDMLGLARAKALSLLATTPQVPVLREIAIATAVRFKRGRIPRSAFEGDMRLERLGFEHTEDLYSNLMRVQKLAEWEAAGFSLAQRAVFAQDCGLDHLPVEQLALPPPMASAVKLQVARDAGVALSELLRLERLAKDIWLDES